jgi:uncharacterized protein (TIGR03643 family)
MPLKLYAGRIVILRMKVDLTPAQVERVIEMAWEDRTPFEAIKAQFGLRESEVIVLMRRQLSRAGWQRWRQRVQGRATKHAGKRAADVQRFRCTRQRSVSANQIAKRRS